MAESNKGNEYLLKLEGMLPSGIIMWFYGTKAPTGWAICDGTNGTPDLIGRYPLGSLENPGELVEAGLPNITGQSGDLHVQIVGGNGQSHGAITTRAPSTDAANDGTSGYGSQIEFDASQSNSIYGNSDTVTPPSTKLLPIMKL